MWAIFKLNILLKMVSGQYAKDLDSFALMYAKEYDKCIKRGGDMIYGVPVMNGNVTGMASVIKDALKKGQENGGENFNILAEIYPSAFDAYWLGAEMAPIPNPLLKPGGWPSTPPAPGTIMNIGPNPIQLTISAAIHKALVETLKGLIDNLKNTTVNIPPIGDVNVYDTIIKLIKKEPVADEIKNHPVIKPAKDIYEKYEEAKKKKPAIGAQIKKQIIAAVEEIILQPIIQQVEAAIALANSIPKPLPTKKEIKQFVKDTINGAIPKIDLSQYITIPKLPTKEEFKKMIDDAIPSLEELKAMAFDAIKGLVPDIPYFNFIPPNIVWSTKTNIMIDPFINVAKFHLLGVSGTMSVMAQYPPPAPPAPAIIQWTGYTVIDGPMIPDFPSTVELPQIPEIPKLPEIPALPELPTFPSLEMIKPAIPTIGNIKLPAIG
jgi:acylphosphatase